MLSQSRLTVFVLAIIGLALHSPASAIWIESPAPNQSNALPVAFAYLTDIRPTLNFGSPAIDADTSGPFTITLHFDDQGGSEIKKPSLELYASREVRLNSTVIPAGTNLAEVAGFVDTLTQSTATISVEQSPPGAQLASGEFILYAKIGNLASFQSEWTSRRFYVEGEAPGVVKVPTLLTQGATNQDVTITGTNLTQVSHIDFGANVTVHSLTSSATQVQANVSVGELAVPGPRTVVLSGDPNPPAAALTVLASGIANIEFPSRRLPLAAPAEAPRNAASGAEGVILSTGAYTRDETDLTIRGAMQGITLGRTYRSDINYDGPLGQNWVGFYFQRVEYSSGNIRWYTSTGRQELFSASASGWIAPQGIYVKAERDSLHGTILLTDRHGDRLRFDARGCLTAVIDRNGNCAECVHDHLGQLTELRDDRNGRVKVLYDASGRVDEFRDKVWDSANPRSLRFVYNTQGELTRYKAPTTARYFGPSRLVTEYHYDNSHRLTRIVNPREHESDHTPLLENDYRNGRVVAQRIGGTGPWSYIRYPGADARRIIDPRGLRTDFSLGNGGVALGITRFTGLWAVDTTPGFSQSFVTQIAPPLRPGDPPSFSESFTFNAHFENLRHTSPRGNFIERSYPSPVQSDFGVASQVSVNTLQDSEKSWPINEHAGRWLRMGNDASSYRYYRIGGNTANTLNLDAFVDLISDGYSPGSTYALFTANPDPLAAGNCVSASRCSGPVGSPSTLTRHFTYEPRFQFLKSVVDERANVTTWTYGYEGFTGNDPNGCNLVVLKQPLISLGQQAPQTISTAYTYNTSGQILISANANGVVTDYSYFISGLAQGFLWKTVQDPGGLNITTEYERNAVGDITGYLPPRAHATGGDRTSHRTQLDVNELGQTWHITGPLLREAGNDRAEVYRYFDANGNLAQEFAEYVTFTGSEPSQPSNVHDPATFAKSSQAMQATWIETSMAHNVRNQPTALTVDSVAGATVSRVTWSAEYDASFNLSAVVSPELRRKELFYDERNLLLNCIEGAGSMASGTWRFAYDGSGNRVSSTDPRGYAEVALFDGFDRLSRQTDPLGHFRLYAYDGCDNCLGSSSFSASESLLARTEFEYDELGRIWQTRRLALDHLGQPLGDGISTSLFRWDPGSRLAHESDDAGNVSQYVYDNADRLTLTRDALLNELQRDYDLGGALKRCTFREINGLSGMQETSIEEFDLDRMGRVTRSRDRRFGPSLNTQTEFRYDSRSQLVALHQPGDTQFTESEFSYDLRGQQTRATLKPSASPETWIVMQDTFDDDGLCTDHFLLENPTESQPSWQETHYDRDERGRIYSMRRPDGQIWSYGYDAASNMISRSDPSQTLATFTYDARGCQTQADISRGPSIKGSTLETWIWDGLRRLTQAATFENASPRTQSHWSYNTLSVAEVHNQSVWRHDGTALGTFTSRAEFDANSFCTSLTQWNGRRVEYTPDALKRVASLFDSTNNQLIASFIYSGGERIQEITHGNATKTLIEYEPLALGTNGRGDLIERVNHISVVGGASLFSADARYDVTGEIAAQRYGHEGARGQVYRRDSTTNPALFSSKCVRSKLEFDDLSLPPSPIPAFFSSKCVKTKLEFDDLSLPPSPIPAFFSSKCVKTKLEFDDLSLPPSPIPAFFGSKCVKTTLEFDELSGPLDGPRLAHTYYGVDMFDNAGIDDLNGMADPASVPSVFELARDYELDSASNRNGPSATRDRDDNGQTIHDTPYVVGANKSNRYESVDSAAIAYDLLNRPTYDAAKGLYYAYDWAGRVVAVDDSADLMSPERVSFYDAQGRLVLEQMFYSTGNNPICYGTSVILTGCGASSDECPLAELSFDNTPSLSGFVQFDSFASPKDGNACILHELAQWEQVTEHRFRHADVQSRLIGVTDLAGYRTAEYGYTDWGTPMLRPVVFDGPRARITSVLPDLPLAGQTTLVLNTNSLTAGELAGRELCVAIPLDPADRYRTATVLGNTSNTLVVGDPLARIYAALNGTSQGFVVFDFNDTSVPGAATFSSGGLWDVEAQYSSSGDATTFTHTLAEFAAYQAGWMATVDAEGGGYLSVSAIPASTGVELRGQAQSLSGIGKRYRVYAPVGVDAATGATGVGLVRQGSRYLLGSQRYVGPISGFYNGQTILGAQPGKGHQGLHLKQGREFDPALGRYRAPAARGGTWLNRFQ